MKELVYRGMTRSVEEHMGAHVEALKECFASEDHQEGVRSFLERRRRASSDADPRTARTRAGTAGWLNRGQIPLLQQLRGGQEFRPLCVS